MIKVVITQIPRWYYFQWFLLGFYEMQEAGEIKLKIETNFSTKLSTIIRNKYLAVANRRYLPNKDDYNLRGYIELSNGLKKYFCIDSADAPYLFNGTDLENVSVYFKMQCPKNLNTETFSLTPDVKIPWSDHAHEDPNLKELTARGKREICTNFAKYRYKIKPLMIGPRKIDYSNAYCTLQKSFEKNCAYSNYEDRKKLMAYFGNSNGPVPSVSVTEPDYDWESDIVAYFGNKIEHPNIKRGKACDILREFGDEYDARIINQSYSDTKIKSKVHTDLEIPYCNFNEYVSHFQYNLNISGYRMSIPNRFIESFMVGTAIVTDQLSLQWYLPFEEEVIETVPMGYLPDSQVNWEQFKHDIVNLPVVSSNKVRENFEKKWAPKVVAQYILKTVEQSR